MTNWTEGPVELDVLTTRQREILELIAKGLTNEEIGSLLGRSAATVRTHVSTILRSLQVSNRTEAAALLRNAPEVSDSIPRGDGAMWIEMRPARSTGDERAREYANCMVLDTVRLLSHQPWFPVVYRREEPSFEPVRPGFIAHLSTTPTRSAVYTNLEIEDGATGRILWTDRIEVDLDRSHDYLERYTHRLVGRAHRRLGTIAFERALATEIRERDALSHARIAQEDLETATPESLKNARAGFERALCVDPSCGVAWCGLALADALETSTEPEAEDGPLATACRRHAWDLAERQVLEGLWARRRGRIDAALRWHRAAAETNPAYPRAFAALAETSLMTGSPRAAEVYDAWAQELGSRRSVVAAPEPWPLARLIDAVLACTSES